MNKNTKNLLAISVILFFVATFAYATVRLSVSKQKVKTLRATFAYQ